MKIPYAVFVPLSPDTTNFRENIELLWKRENSMVWLKLIPSIVQVEEVCDHS